METFYLQVVQKSDSKLKVIYYGDTGKRIGGINIFQTGYRLLHCMEYAGNFPTALTDPATQDRWWVFEKHGLETVIYFLGQQLLSQTASPELCDHPDHVTWADDWGQKISRISFPWSTDQGIIFYRIGRSHHLLVMI